MSMPLTGIIGHEERLWSNTILDLGLTDIKWDPPDIRKDGFDNLDVQSIRSYATHVRDVKSDNKLSTLEPHHMVDIVYPAIDLLKDPHAEIRSKQPEYPEYPLLHFPRNADERYQPFPLIRDAAVFNNTKRDNAAASAFPSIYRVVIEEARSPRWSGEVFDDIREALCFPGKTKLKVVLFHNTPSGDRQDPSFVPMVRINRITTLMLDHPAQRVRSPTFLFDDNYEVRNEQTYDIPLYAFRQAFDESSSSFGVGFQWYHDLVGLLSTRDFRSAAHIQSTLYTYAHDSGGYRPRQFFNTEAKKLFEKFCSCWKRKSIPALLAWFNTQYGGKNALPKDDVLARSFKRASDLPKTCAFCKDEFRQGHQYGVKMPCCNAIVDKSCLWRQCYLSIAMNVQPPFDKVPRCRHCGVAMNMEQASLEQINEEASYNDETSTRWDRFERVCRDLDEVDPSKTTKTIPYVDSELFEKVWSHFISSSIREDDPVHARFAQSEEMKIHRANLFRIVQGLDFIGGSNEDAHRNISTLWRYLRAQMFARWKIRFKDHGRDEVILPTGFEDFTDRALHRTLMFHVLRYCDCDNPQPHFHHTHDGVRVMKYNIKRRYMTNHTEHLQGRPVVRRVREIEKYRLFQVQDQAAVDAESEHEFTTKTPTRPKWYGAI